MKVYVCYQTNSSQIAIDCGTVNCVEVKANLKDAIIYATKNIEEGVKNGFIVDKEYSPIDEIVVKNILSKNDYFSVTLFKDYQENWKCSYDVVIERRNVQQ